MKLKEALDIIHQLGEDEVIFAIKPWTLDSEATIDQFDDEMRVPQNI